MIEYFTNNPIEFSISMTVLMWLMYVITMYFKPMYNEGRMYPVIKQLFMLFVLFFAVFNVIFNYTVAAVYFREFMPWERRMFSKRIQWYLDTENGHWKWDHAAFICLHILQPQDQTHCHLKEL